VRQRVHAPPKLQGFPAQNQIEPEALQSLGQNQRRSWSRVGNFWIVVVV